MHGNRINNVLKELKIAKQHLNDALYTLQQGEHPAAEEAQLLVQHLDVVVNKILSTGTNANPR